MITDFTYTYDTAGVKTKIAQNSKVSKGLKRLFVIAIIIFIAELIWLFGVSPFIPFSTIDVHGFNALERNEILQLAGIDDTSSYYSANVNEIQEKLASYILVESAKVIKRFPDKLSIILTPRQPVAVAITNIESKPLLVYVDRQGVFFKSEEKIPQELHIPVISGIENPQVYMRLPDALASLTESLSVIGLSSPELLASISEIKIERKAWAGYELVLYPVHSTIKVRVENNLQEDTLRYILLMLNVFNSVPTKPEEIDFRSGIGSYKIREQSL